MGSETQELNGRIQEQYDLMDRQNQEEISPAVLAEIVYLALDPNRISPTLIQLAAILELRQLARGVCREREVAMERDAESGQGELFQLQKRYPARRDEEDVYVLRHRLTYQERMRNVQRLESESGAKQAHADALRAETETLVATGSLEISIAAQ